MIEGVDWLAIPARPAVNSLDLGLENIAQASVDGKRARLDGRRPLRVTLTSDGAGTVEVRLPFPAGAQAVLVSGGGAGWSASVTASGATFTTATGTATYEIR